ncbi:MAG: hypothetical protein S4CHLAM102_02340 [Chlamydiia bacterium]|nr:hypothetical protein [Chlamydiia bacterium]
MQGCYAIVVRFVTGSGRREEFQGFLESIVPIALASPGCIQHDLFCSREHPNEFLFYEVWESKEAHEAHVERAEVGEWRKQLEEYLVEPYEAREWVPR